MKINTNKVKDIFDYYKNELVNFYDEKESISILKILFKETCNISRTEMIVDPELRISESDILKIHFAVKEIRKYKPIQYITGKTNFYGLDFFVNECVLIPRPETEELIELIINENKNRKSIKILDIGTGSGCIAIALKKEFNNSEIYALDKYADALKVAEENSQKHNLKINLLKINILNKSETETLPQFDIIVSNPPYIQESEKKLMQRNVLDYEPESALFVNDNDPLIFYKAISEFAKSYLKTKGKLYFEINEAYGNEVKKMLEDFGFKKVVLKNDLNGKNRMVCA
ncbi:MAG: peptide chain release factor N(5)-glutamine methyltransferase, partial [Bacteroidales bacterium]|nr:peptide chain release factor N(5)-glutamine methyltransferase [Bacteroidales bacterium]